MFKPPIPKKRMAGRRKDYLSGYVIRKDKLFWEASVKEKDKFNKKIGEFTMQDISDGLYAIVTVKIPEPQFQGQTKGRLGNSYVKTQMDKIIYKYITDFFTAHPEEFDKILQIRDV